MANFTRTISVTTSTNFSNKVKELAIRIMEERLTKAQEVALSKLKELIVIAIKGSRVYKGLGGQYDGYTDGSDLQAEFGLTDSAAQTALQSLLNILEHTCRVYTKKEVGPVSKLTVNSEFLNPNDYEKFLLFGDFTYNSVTEKGNTSHPIEWMIWLLEASTDIVAQTLPNIEKYGITYDLKSKETQRSRSKRALMVQDRTRVIPRRFGQSKRKTRWGEAGLNKTANFPYVLPKICLPVNGNSKNFIEDIANSREFRFMVTNLVEKEIFKVLKPKTALPGRLKE